MSQEILQPPILISDEADEQKAVVSSWQSYIPFVLAMLGSFALVGLRISVGGEKFISDGALMMLALAAYCAAAVFYLTNLYAPSNFAERLGMWSATLGVFFNLSSWLVRWVAAHDREVEIFLKQGRDLAELPWLFRYIPFANLYDLSLAFAFGAGVTTLLVMRHKQFQIIAALSLPLAAIILVLARFIGDQFIDLPPVLDSYWRPIHVGIASLSYGVALVCFAVAVLYLLKDGMKVETMGIWTSVFALSVFATISKFSVFAPSTFGIYTASTFMGESRFSLALRADVPYVGWLLVGAAALLLGAIATHWIYLSKGDEKARTIGHRLLQLALVAQAAGIAMLVYQIKNIQNVLAYINPAQYERFAVWMLQQEQVPQQQINQIPSAQLYTMANQWVQQNGSQLHLSLNANPVELAALITAFTGTFFIVLFSFKTEKFRVALPKAETLDGLMYKLAGMAFAGLALLLITGAVWANESWGRSWGWDAKEVGALVAWLTYAGFLHSRIARGWQGRRSAYFAIVAFLFVIFTYLGVSYLLPGLHSYA
ncbi:MAG TPA: cytochrome c biogenesis protein CcsA [Pyrinomonadaceae bacterium]|nr:cytochrome c biogenesis protein CcsA [Pyrinomonadaceae bacterium]